MAETSVINRIAIHATAETSLPTLADKGSNIAQTTWSSASYTTIGSVERGSDDLDMSGDDVSVTIDRVIEEIMQTRGLQRQDLILLQNRITEFSIILEDISEEAWTLGSDISVSSNVATFGTSLAFRTVAVEISGVGVDYYPKCAVFVNSSRAGYGEGGKASMELICMPLATSSVPAGFQHHLYQPGS